MQHKWPDTFSWVDDDLEVRDSPKGGIGLFAKRSFQKDAVLVVFGGYVFSRDVENALVPELRDIAFMVAPNLVMGIKSTTEMERSSFINHSCEPNSGFKGQIFMVAMRAIEPDEEIVFDYGMVLSPVPGVAAYGFDCECKHSSCRGRVSESDWERPELQKKYRGYFQYYIQEKIDRHQSN